MTSRIGEASVSSRDDLTGHPWKRPKPSLSADCCKCNSSANFLFKGVWCFGAPWERRKCAKGDGSDSVDFSISGYSQDDVIVTQQPGRTTVSFKGSGDSLVFDHGSNGSARLSFADHTSVDIRA
jgi:hypothetical protein